MGKLKGELPFFGVLLLDFYLLPLLMRDTGSAMLLLLVLMPLVCLGTAAVRTAKKGFCPWFALGAALLFAPCVPLFYNATAWVYCPAFGVLALLGSFAGLPFRKR